MVEVEERKAFVLKGIFGNIGEETTHPLSSFEALPNLQPQSAKCPSCGSSKTWRDGLRWNPDQTIHVQRYLCRKCDFRFSEQPLPKNSSQSLNNVVALPYNRQICAKIEAKNLDSASEIKTVAGEENTTQHGLIVEFQWKMKKRQLTDITITNRTILLNALVKFGADLLNPESIETILATEDISVPTKYNMVKAYRAFTLAFKIDWDPVKIRYEAKEPFDPLEEEIDLLIASCGKISGTFLQTLKDTGARCGEIRQLQWTDITRKTALSQLTIRVRAAEQEQLRLLLKQLLCSRICKRKTATMCLAQNVLPLDEALIRQGNELLRECRTQDC